MTPSDNLLDPETALHIVNLAPDVIAGQDLTLLLENKGTVIEGESLRLFDDGKRRMDARGYLLLANSSIAPATHSAKISTSALYVVRQCDAASASVANLLKSQSEDLLVVLSTFKASGDDASTDTLPTLEVQINKGRVCYYAILTPSSMNGSPCEIIGFAHQSLEIRSAEQTATGARGAVRTCAFNT